MVNFLRKDKFSVYPLTICRLTGCEPDSTAKLITKEHVVLASCVCGRDESSWFILYGGAAYHNFDRLEINSLFFLNKPIRSAYILSHPEWEKQRPKMKKLLKLFKLV